MTHAPEKTLPPPGFCTWPRSFVLSLHSPSAEMSFGRPASHQAAWSERGGALAEQIEKIERLARRAMDAKLAELEAREGEVRSSQAWLSASC